MGDSLAAWRSAIGAHYLKTAGGWNLKGRPRKKRGGSGSNGDQLGFLLRVVSWLAFLGILLVADPNLESNSVTGHEPVVRMLTLLSVISFMPILILKITTFLTRLAALFSVALVAASPLLRLFLTKITVEADMLSVLVFLFAFFPGCGAVSTSTVLGNTSSLAHLGSNLVTMLFSLLILFAGAPDDDDSEEEREEDLFTEDFNLNNEGGEVPEDLEDPELPGLSITREHARRNYQRAGTEVPEEECDIRMEDYPEVHDPKVEAVLDSVIEEARLPYTPSTFQRVGALALGKGRSVVIVQGTGSGKMTVPLLSSLVMRITQEKPRGVTVITQPLTGLMMEQLQNPIARVAVLSMGGELSVGKEEHDAKLNCSVEDLLAGEFPVLLGHPESFASPLGQRILSALKRQDQILMVTIDEFHTNLHWSAFRSEMMRSSTGLRAFAQRGAPVCIMTATATEREVREVVRCLGLRQPPVLIASSPVQSHIKFSVIRRPSNAFGLEGKEGRRGEIKPGMWALLADLYFREMFRDLDEGRSPKKVIIFFRGLGLMASLHSFLCRMTRHCNASTSPFVMFHSDITAPTEKVIQERMGDISCFLATTRIIALTNYQRRLYRT